MIDNKKYVGYSVDIKARLSNHKYHLKTGDHSNNYLQNAWDKHGEENFSFYTVEICSDNCLLEKEILYIKYFESKLPSGYNMTDGGDGILNPSLSVIEKLSKANSGKNNPRYHVEVSQETKEKQSKAHKGIKFSEEARKNMSEAQRKCADKKRGWHHSDESKKKMSETRQRILKEKGFVKKITNPNFTNQGLKRDGCLSEFVGLSWSTKAKKWLAIIRKNKKIYYLGIFNSEIEAAEKYDEWAIYLYGIDARLNFEENRNKYIEIVNKNTSLYYERLKNKRKNASSIFIGVYLKSGTNKWAARIYYGGCNFHIGYFCSELEAAIAYNEVASELYGFNAKLNNIPEEEYNRTLINF